MKHQALIPGPDGFLPTNASLIGSLILAAALGWITRDFKTSGLILLGLLFLCVSWLVARKQQEMAYNLLGTGGVVLLAGANWISGQALLKETLQWQVTGAVLWLLVWILTSRFAMKAGAGLCQRSGRDGEAALPRLSTLSLMFLCYLAAFVQLGLLFDASLTGLAGRFHLPAWTPIDVHGLPRWPILTGWAGILFLVISWGQRQKVTYFLAFSLIGLAVLSAGSWWASFDPWWLWSVTWISAAFLLVLGGHDIRRIEPRTWRFGLLLGIISFIMALGGPVLIHFLR